MQSTIKTIVLMLKDGRQIHIDASAVAADRANYYMQNGSTQTHKEIFDETIANHSSLKSWLLDHIKSWWEIPGIKIVTTNMPPLEEAVIDHLIGLNEQEALMCENDL